MELKTCDKVVALNLLGRHLGMFRERIDLGPFDMGSLSVEQLRRLAAGEDPAHVLVGA